MRQITDVLTVFTSDGSFLTWLTGRLPFYTLPAGRDFMCFEPMSAITNAFNLAHAGVYHELESIPPRGSWQESYWIKPGGF
jgi:galactose mutarotase-like enzyme